MTNRATDNEVADELRFHLRELWYDLRGLREGCAAPLPPPDADANVYRELRYRRLGGLDVAVDHDATYHAPRALALAEALAAGSDVPPFPERSETPEASVGNITAAEAYRMLEADYRQLQDALARAQALVPLPVDEDSEASLNVEALIPTLTELIHILASEALPAAVRLQPLARHLHRLADPISAAMEDREAELEPLQDLHHPDARRLSSCPHCGASLGPDNRIRYASYCEACRTLWSDD